MEARATGALTQIPLAAIRPNPYQPRHAVDEAGLAELAESMRTSGLLQPIVVRPGANGAFELIAGERRWRAAQQLGWTEIGGVVREVDDQTLLTLALVENLQRDALSPIDEARGYARLIEQFGVSQSEVGNLVSRSRSTVSNALRLLKLPQSVQEMVHRGELSTGHARALLTLEQAGAIGQMARKVVAQEWSVRELEARVRGGRAPQRRPRARRGVRSVDPEVRRLEDMLRRRLQTDVRVTRRGKGSGRVTINFYSSEDLSRVLELILGDLSGE